MRRHWLGWAALAALVLGSAGCGSEDGNKPAPTDMQKLPGKPVAGGGGRVAKAKSVNPAQKAD
jgi:hypothetical protein